MGDKVDARNSKVGILKIRQQHHIGGNSKHQPAKSERLRGIADTFSGPVIEDNRAEQQWNIRDIPPAIEKQGRQCQPPGRPLVIQPRKRKKNTDHRRQEQEQKTEGVEKHVGLI